MYRTMIFAALLTMLFWTANAEHVDEATAKRVGHNFLMKDAGSDAFMRPVHLELVYSAVYRSISGGAFPRESTLFYVFNVDSRGFVIVAGDDNVPPILVYSNEAAFDPVNKPPNAAKWLEQYRKQIIFIIENSISATRMIQEEWINYLQDPGDAVSKQIVSVAPLLQTKWNQSPYVNALCPFDYSRNERTVSGCVATAMVQIMKFWNYPQSGTGFHSYNHSTYGTLSANFAGTTYQWDAMPNVVNSQNTAVATVMYHAGVSVEMNYGTASTGGSGAWIANAFSPVVHTSEYALTTYFNYNSTLRGVGKRNYSDAQWIDLLKSELNARRPILYAGSGTGGGHAFVCDGYDNNNFFHFNWGWGGAYDGYFRINELNPSGTGTGGGTGSYNFDQHAIIGIEPPASGDSYDMALYDFVTPSSQIIPYGDSFHVTTNIVNNGNSNFRGDYCAAVFDEQYNFIDFIEILTDYTLRSGYVYTNNLVFSNSGLYTMLPGSYYIGIFYRSTGGEWNQVANSGIYSNLIEIGVIHWSDIELNSDLAVTPGSTLTRGQPVSINLNIVNDGLTMFIGEYSVGLYRLDGSLAQIIDTYEEANGLPSGYTYIAPYLTFSSTSVNVPAGSYLMAVQHKPRNRNWRLTGSAYHQNPIMLVVREPQLALDRYEPNNTANQAYNLQVSFSGNSARVNTSGSNLHTGADNDFYKISLPIGYDYVVTARLHDSYDSDDGNTYTVDALFSYSIGGSIWSEPYDDVMPSNITVKNGGTVFFHVAPYFAGESGTYLLDIRIQRHATTGIRMDSASDIISVFPNPAVDRINIDLSAVTENISFVELINSYGQQVATLTTVRSDKTAAMPLHHCPEGVYFLRVYTARGVNITKVVLFK